MRSRTTLVILLCLLCTISISQAKASPADTAKKPLDTLKIVYFGSSVSFGFGGKDNFGYTSWFTKTLQQRIADGTGKAWTTVNKSVGGDNTVRLMARWKRDLVPQKAKYVLIALSLGNEWAVDFGKSKVDQFKTGLLKLIAIARDNGYTPVIANCYTRNDFIATEYDYVKQTDMWIHSLNVPSINLLGAIDDGFGRWVNGYWFNEGHPNDAGHREMSYAIVPSLFDALANGKPQPKMIEGSYLTWGSSNKTKPISFKPDNTLHAFTTCITIKIDAKGRVLTLKDSTGKSGSVEVNGDGTVTYKSATKQTITGNNKINDGKWHKIILTHYYARGETDLYCDSLLQGKATEKLVTIALTLGEKAGKNLSAKNWLFYRSGMNIIEARALSADVLLKSSLELYAPLDGEHLIMKDELGNLAQSTIGLKWVE
jgi:lysophospholipase L1-like esterase